MPSTTRTAEQRQAISEAMKKKWQDPAFVDKHMRAMVQRWQNPVYRRRQIEAILGGRRTVPLAMAPGELVCGELVALPGQTAPCMRGDVHSYHVAVTGRAEDWSLRVHGSPDGEGRQ